MNKLHIWSLIIIVLLISCTKPRNTRANLVHSDTIINSDPKPNHLIQDTI